MSIVPFSILSLIIYIIYIIIFGFSIYSFVLFIKLARRGIKALDIYISDKSNNNS